MRILIFCDLSILLPHRLVGQRRAFGSVSSNSGRFDASQSQLVYAIDNAIVFYCRTKEAHHGFVPTLSRSRHSECSVFVNKRIIMLPW